MYTFGFFTSYTNIPYHKLKSVIGELKNFCVNGGDKKSLGPLDMVLSGKIAKQ